MAAHTGAVAATEETAADTSKVYDLDEIVVVSQPKEGLRLRQQPLSSSAAGEAEMASLGIRDLGGLSAFVPSFAMPAYGSRLTSSMYVRGIGSRVNSPAVGMYVDGVPVMSKAALNFHTYQAERVDILRGPQGTLYGMNTEGGLVRMYSRNPMRHQGTEVSLGIGTALWRNAEAAHYARPSDRFAYSVAGFYSGTEGYFKNTTLGTKADKAGEAGGKARLIYAPSKRLSADLTADYQHTAQNGFPYGRYDLGTGNVADPSTNIQGEYRRDMLNTGLNISYHTGGTLLSSQTSYQLLRDHMLMDQDYLPEPFMHLEHDQRQDAVTQEFSIRNTPGGAWQWTAGLFGSYQWLDTDAPVFFDEAFTGMMARGIQAAMLNALPPAMKQGAQMDMGITLQVPERFSTPQLNLAAYHESNVKLSERLTATLGLRVDYNRVEVDYDSKAVMNMKGAVKMKMGPKEINQPFDNTLSSHLVNGTAESYMQLLPKAGLTLSIGPAGNIYATAAKGFRAGGYNIQMFSDILQAELNANSGKAKGGNLEIAHTPEDYERVDKTIAYKPEESWNYEIGAHLNLLGGSLHADMAAYYMQIRNQQLSVMAGNYGFGRMMVNAGASHSYGAELSLRGKAAGGHLDLAATYSLTNAEFTEYSDSVKGKDGSAALVDYKGKRVPFVPQHSMSLMADYRFDMKAGPVKAVVIGANMTGNGKTYWDEANSYSQGFYTLLGAHADAVFDKVRVSLWGKNLTGTRYNTFAIASSATGTQEHFAQRGLPLQAGVEVKICL